MATAAPKRKSVEVPKNAKRNRGDVQLTIPEVLNGSMYHWLCWANTFVDLLHFDHFISAAV